MISSCSTHQRVRKVGVREGKRSVNVIGPGIKVRNIKSSKSKLEISCTINSNGVFCNGRGGIYMTSIYEKRDCRKGEG